MRDHLEYSIDGVIEKEVRSAESYYSRGADATTERLSRLVELVGLLAESLPPESKKEFVSKLYGWRVIE